MSSARQRSRVLGLGSGAFLFAVMVTLVGCGPGSEDEAAPKRTDTHVPRLTNANSQEMPLDEYLLNPEQTETVFSAYSASVASCMREYGFTYRMSTSSYSGIGADAPKTRVDGRFGFQSMAHAKKWGYRPDGGFPDGERQSTGPAPDADKWFALTGTRDLSEDAGSGGVAQDGRRVRGGGCVGDALLEITGSRNGVIGDAEAATDLKFKTLVEGQQDMRTLEVFGLWSRCMKGYHYSYRSPLEALGDVRWAKSKEPTDVEIGTAVADQKCRSRHNVVGVWFAADFERQELAVKANRKKLLEVKEQLIRQVRAAEQIIKKSKTE